MFHYKDGFYAKRNDDGSVTLMKHKDASCQCRRAEFEFTIDPSGWASIVASVTKSGETGNQYQKATELHAS